MDKEIGDKTFPIWLIGDSAPGRWEPHLKSPFDPRHPARHSIWTPVLDVIQDELFRKARIRLETQSLYIRNAVRNDIDKPKSNVIEWLPEVHQEVERLRSDMAEYRPKMLISFGSFSFEFVRRAFEEKPHRSDHWDTINLGNEFRQRLGAFRPTDKNLIPLLHVSISGGNFLSSHRNFSAQGADANYFEHVGLQMAEKLLDYRDQLDVWIK